MGKRIGIAIAGGAVILVGLVLSIPLVPGPGVALIVLGIAILSLEFERPRRWLARMKVWALAVRARWQAWRLARKARRQARRARNAS